MTQTFSRNGNNDIHAIDGLIQIVSGQEAVLQTCERAVKVTLNELIYQQGRGINYFEDVFSGSPNVIRFEAQARAQIRRVPGVVSIEDFNAVVENNLLTYTATIITSFGAGSING